MFSNQSSNVGIKFVPCVGYFLMYAGIIINGGMHGGKILCGNLSLSIFSFPFIESSTSGRTDSSGIEWFFIIFSRHKATSSALS